MTFKNAGDAVARRVALRQALTVSSDVFFYRLGLEANGAGDGLLLQNWARRLGLGRDDRHRPARRAAAGLMPDAASGATSSSRRSSPTAPGAPGDNINLSVGQGDLQANPLQMAVAYAAIANGGRVVRAAPRPADRGRRRPRAPGARRRRAARRLEDQARSTARRSSRACAAPPARRAAPRPTSSRASRSRSPARPARRRRAPAAPTSPGTWRWRRTRAPSTWWR